LSARSSYTARLSLAPRQSAARAAG
jgi:hypothetical protein